MKLYWRYKKDGKWSWKPAKVFEDRRHEGYRFVLEEEE